MESWVSKELVGNGSQMFPHRCVITAREQDAARVVREESIVAGMTIMWLREGRLTVFTWC